MNGKPTLYIDQWRGHYWAMTVKELRSQIGGGGGRVSKMYVSSMDGRSVHIGYCVGQHWLTAYQPVEK